MTDIIERLESLADCDARSGEPLGKAMIEAKAEIKRLRGALEDIAEGEPEWPNDPAKEVGWCRNRALAAYQKDQTNG